MPQPYRQELRTGSTATIWASPPAGTSIPPFLPLCIIVDNLPHNIVATPTAICFIIKKI